MSNRSIEVRLEERLKEMNRKTFLHRGHPVKILDWNYEGDYVKVETTREIMLEPHNVMLTRLTNDFLDTEEELPDSELDVAKAEPKAPPAIVPKLKSFDVADQMMDGLLRAFGEVENNAGFKDQAQVMANMAGKVIDYAKVQVDAYRVAHEIMKKG